MFQQLQKGAKPENNQTDEGNPFTQSVTLLGIVVAYLLMGGFCFQQLEQSYEKKRLEARVDARKLINQYWLVNISNSKGHELLLKSGAIAKFVEELAVGVREGRINVSSYEEDRVWDNFMVGVYYAVSIVTTIGYGHINVKSFMSFWLVIIYGSIGIPLNYVMLSHLGGHVKSPITRFITWVKEHVPEEKFRFVHRSSNSALLMTIMLMSLLIFMGFCSLVFMELEQWTFTQSFYFTFVTLSTIGFGDYTAAVNEKLYPRVLVIYRIFFFFVVFVGLAWLSTLLSLHTDAFSKGTPAGPVLGASSEVKASQSWSTFNADDKKRQRSTKKPVKIVSKPRMSKHIAAKR